MKLITLFISALMTEEIILPQAEVIMIYCGLYYTKETFGFKDFDSMTEFIQGAMTN